VHAAYPDENNRRRLCHESVELEQRRELVLLAVDVDEELLNALDGQFIMRQRQYIGVGCKALSVFNDGWREGGREEHHLFEVLEEARHVSMQLQRNERRLTS
jgi:hypothetical protein